MTHDVLSAFLDNEEFDAAELARALEDPAGREMLLDLVALRALVGGETIDAGSRAAPRPGVSPRTWVAAGFLAASIVFGAGAAWLLPPLLHQQRADVPPTPDHVVVFDTLRDTP